MGLNLSRLFKPTNPDKPLGGRYKIISQLGAGGFGQTFLAQDLHLPGHPQCVVKQLKPQVSDPESLQTARRLFEIEAQVLYQLGNHDQIPRLLAHFEDNQEFYLAQELIEGEPLTQELAVGLPWPEMRVIALLQDLLQVLAFVHQQNVIHRDIKPSNLICRRQDGRIVLIDFGAVKQVSTQIINHQSGHTKTISIGTQGYTPKEQLGGNPRFSSDVYAAGIIGIQALTGIHPRRLSEDPQTGEIDWRGSAPQVSPELAAILDRMVRYDYRVRYSTAAEALEALRNLPTAIAKSEPISQEWSQATAILPNQELQLPSTTNGSIESETEISSTPIWRPTEPSAQFPSSAAPTEFGKDISATPIWRPTEPPVPQLPTARNTSSREPQAISRHSQQSGSSVPMIATTGLSQKQSVKPWIVLAVLGTVGATVLITKTLPFPQLVIQTADRREMPTSPPSVSPTETPVLPAPVSSPASPPTASPAETPVLPSPASSPAKTPNTSTTKPSALPSPASSPVETPKTSAAKTSAPPSPARLPASTQAVSEPVQPVAKPTPAPAQPAAKSTPSRQEPQASELLSQADRLREAGQYQKALDLYDQAIARNPDIAQAYWGRCYSLNFLQQPAEAIAACNQALDLNPSYPEALWSKGNALDQQQHYMDALTLYQQATALKPDFAEAWNNQGAALLALGRAKEAVAALNKATALKPDFADAWANRGAALWSLQRFRPAIASINKALQIQPDNQNALNLRRQAQEKLGR